MIVLQCGADSLAGDRLGCFNLSIDGANLLVIENFSFFVCGYNWNALYVFLKHFQIYTILFLIPLLDISNWVELVMIGL